MAGQMGDREQITFRGFRGVDLQRTGLFPEAFVPQEDAPNGLLLDALNCRFSQGRAYWHRNQFRVKPPAKYSGSIVTPTGATASRSAANVVTVTTAAEHGLVAGNSVTTSGFTPAGATEFNGTFIVATAATTKTFTFAQTAAADTATGGTVTPLRPLALYEFVNDSHNQILCFGSDGSMYWMPVVWSATPTAWDYGYQCFSALTWTEVTGLPTTAIQAFADMHGVLMMAHPTMATKRWDGATLADVGITTPTPIPSAAGDATGTNHLVAGVYSYYVTFGNAEFESMPSLPVDVTLADTAATGTVTAKVLTTGMAEGDTLTVGSRTYTMRYFVDTPTVHVPDDLAADDIMLMMVGGVNTEPSNRYNFQIVAGAINNGQTHVRADGAVIVTLPHDDVDALATYSPGVSAGMTVTAKVAGSAGTAIVLAESTSDARLHVSGATLTGGVDRWHVDLSAIPTGPTGTTFRRLWRAYTADIFDGVRGTSFLYLATINDNTATTYADDTPQGDLGEPIAFDHAMPPQGDVLAYHRDRLWMAGVAQTSYSYWSQRVIAAATGLVRYGSVVAATVTVAHTLTVGDIVTIAGADTAAFNGTFTVTSTPTSLTFTYAQGGANATTQNGTVTYGVYTANLGNILFYSQADEPYYWPAINQITVGSSTPILGMISWHDELLIFKSDGVFRLLGYGESDWQLIALPGATGAISNDIAASPYGVMWAGPAGWMMYDGQQVRTALEFSEPSAYSVDIPNIGPPRLASEVGNARFPAIAFHDDRFHLRGTGGAYTYCWRPQTDTWEVYRRATSQCGFRAFSKDVYQSHLLTFMRWGDTAVGLFEITVLDSLYKPATNYGNTKGTYWDAHADVRIELPAIAPQAGLEVVPLEVFISGQWTKPSDDANDLKLAIYAPATPAWTSIGTARQESRTGIPAGYAYPRLRMRLYGVETAFLALHGLTLTYQRRAARGYTP